MATSSYFDYAKNSNFPNYSGSMRTTPSFDVGKAYTGGYGDLSSKSSSSQDKWGPALSFLKEYSNREGFRSGDREGSRDRYPFMGQGSSGWGGQLLEGLGIAYPQQHGPMYIPGEQGRNSGLFGSIGGLAGALGTGLGVFGPLGSAIGAGVGGLIDTARG